MAENTDLAPRAPWVARTTWPEAQMPTPATTLVLISPPRILVFPKLQSKLSLCDQCVWADPPLDKQILPCMCSVCHPGTVWPARKAARGPGVASSGSSPGLKPSHAADTHWPALWYPEGLICAVSCDPGGLHFCAEPGPGPSRDSQFVKTETWNALGIRSWGRGQRAAFKSQARCPQPCGGPRQRARPGVKVSGPGRTPGTGSPREKAGGTATGTLFPRTNRPGTGPHLHTAQRKAKPKGR